MKFVIAFCALVTILNKAESARLRSIAQDGMQLNDSTDCETSAAFLIATSGGQACSSNDTAVLSKFLCGIGENGMLSETSSLSMLSLVGQSATCAQAVYSNFLPTIFYQRGVPCAEVMSKVFDVFFSKQCPQLVASQVSFKYCEAVFAKYTARIPTVETINKVIIRNHLDGWQGGACLRASAPQLAEFAKPFELKGSDKCKGVLHDTFYGKTPQCSKKSLEGIVDLLCSNTDLIKLTNAASPNTTEVLVSVMSFVDAVGEVKVHDVNECLQDINDFITVMPDGGSAIKLKMCVDDVRNGIAANAAGCKHNGDLSDALAVITCKLENRDIGWITDVFDVEKYTEAILEAYPQFSREEVGACVEDAKSEAGNMWSR